MNRDLPVIGNRLNAKNPNVIAAQPPTDGASQADMMARLAVIIGEYLGPMIIGLELFPAQHRGIEISLKPASSRPPNIEIAVAPRLENQEDNGKNACKEEWQRRGFSAREGYREGDAKNDHRPVCRIVKPRAPDGAAVNLSPIEMRKRTNGCRVERV